jgi:hypothetical protein
MVKKQIEHLTGDEWEKQIFETGAKIYSSRVYPAEYLAANDVIDVYWLDNGKTEEDFSKIRNAFARKLRADGFKVTSTSSSCMGNTFINLEAERKK